MKVKEFNGYKYSTKQFEGYTNRARFEFYLLGKGWVQSGDIYTNNNDRKNVKFDIVALSNDKVQGVKMVLWRSKDDDDCDAWFIDNL